MRNLPRQVVQRVLVRVCVGLIFAAGLFLVQKASAQSTDSCSHEGSYWYKYRVSGTSYGGDTGYTLPSRDAMCAFGEAAYCANRTTGNCSTAKRPWHGTTGTACSTATNINVFSFPGARQAQANPAVDCPANPPPEVVCDFPTDDLGIANFAATQEELPGIACDMGTNCLVSKRPGTTVCGTGPTDYCGALYSYQDAPCNGTTVPENDTPPELASGEATPAERCHTIGDAEYCVTSGGPEGNDAQCGYLNGTFTCVTATPAGGCQSAGTGNGVLCDPVATAPPAPDNGTPGVEASPDGNVEASAAGGNTTNTYNYFNQTTVNNSNGNVTTGQIDHGNDQNGDGLTDGAEDEGPAGTASGGGTCAAAPSCSGDPIQCAVLAQAWKARCVDEGGIEDAVGFSEEEKAGVEAASGNTEVDVGDLDATGVLTVGSCPAATNINVHGQSLSLDLWAPACSMAATFAPFVMMMGYFLAALIFVKD